MSFDIQHDVLNDALRRAGSHWDAAQTHGLLSGRLAIEGVAAGPAWLREVLGRADASGAFSKECESMLMKLFQSTHESLAERLSGFDLLLPDDGDSTATRTEALAHWSEGYLHGLVSGEHSGQLKERLAAEPVGDIIKDMLQITRAGIDADDNDEENEAAYSEIVEYLRVAAQLIYEELAELRAAPAS